MKKFTSLFLLALLCFTAVQAEVQYKGKYVKVDEFKGAGAYIIAAGNKAYGPLSASKTYGYMPIEDLNIKDDAIIANETTDKVRINFKEANGGYSMQDATGRYIALSGNYNSYNVYNEPKESYVWSVTSNDDGTFSIVNVDKNKTIWLSTSYGSWGCYPKWDDDYNYPSLYLYVAGDDQEEEDQITLSSIGDVVKNNTPGKVLVSGTVVATYAKGYLVSDGTGYLLTFLGSASPFAVGDKIIQKGKTTLYAGMLQFDSSVEAEKTGTATVSEPQIEFTGRDMDDMLGTNIVKYGQYTGTLSITSDGYYNVSIPDCQEAIGSISYPASGLINPDWNGSKVTVNGYFIGTSSNKYFNTMVTEITCDDDITPFTVTGDGSKENPYNVESAIYVSQNDNAEAWVKGYIVGFIPSGSIKDATFTTDCDSVSVSNILIADTKDCTDASKCMPVELKSKSQFRADANIHDNPDNLGKEILVCGEFVKYFGAKGIKNVKEYEIEGLDQHVDALLADDSDAIYFDLTGKRIAKPAKGMCIMQKNGKAVKMIIR